MGSHGLAPRWSLVAAALTLVACAAGIEGGGVGSFGSSAGPSTTSDPTESGDSTLLTTGVSASNNASSGPGQDSSGGVDPSSGVGSETPLTTTDAPGECGDGVAGSGEDCDGEDLLDQTCVDFGFEDGILICNPECDLLTEGCRTCGDGMLSMAELCDGGQLGGETCQSQGYGGGALACASDCNALDTSACTPLPSCGDGVRNGAEQCDGADLAGSSCEALGFDFGVLSCNAGACTYNTASCEYLDCGGMGDFCLFDKMNPQSTCCPPGVGGNVFGLCAFFVCQ